MPSQESGFLGALGRRLTETLERGDASELETMSAAAGAEHIADCAHGQKVQVLGRIRTVTHGSADSDLWVTAEVIDGTGSVDAVWLGRRAIPGIDTGRYIFLAGRMTERDGRRVIFNPRYELRDHDSVSVREGSRG